MKYEKYQSGKGRKSDEKLVQLFVTTFQHSEGPEEGALIGKLVRDFLDTTDKGDLHIFIATEGAEVIGSIVFSRLTCGDGTNAFLMAPVAIHPDFQKRGVGQALILFGLKELRREGVQLVMSYGDIDFYSKTGFVPVKEDVVPAPRPLSIPQGWIGNSLDGRAIQPVTGGTICVHAIDDDAYW